LRRGKGRNDREVVPGSRERYGFLAPIPLSGRGEKKGGGYSISKREKKRQRENILRGGRFQERATRGKSNFLSPEKGKRRKRGGVGGGGIVY